MIKTNTEAMKSQLNETEQLGDMEDRIMEVN